MLFHWNVLSVNDSHVIVKMRDEGDSGYGLLARPAAKGMFSSVQGMVCSTSPREAFLLVLTTFLRITCCWFYKTCKESCGCQVLSFLKPSCSSVSSFTMFMDNIHRAVSGLWREPGVGGWREQPVSSRCWSTADVRSLSPFLFLSLLQPSTQPFLFSLNLWLFKAI